MLRWPLRICAHVGCEADEHEQAPRRHHVPIWEVERRPEISRDRLRGARLNPRTTWQFLSLSAIAPIIRRLLDPFELRATRWQDVARRFESRSPLPRAPTLRPN